MARIKLIPEYEKKLKEFKEKLIKAQQFAEKLPCFSDFIIKNIITESPYNQFGFQYKTLKFDWQLTRNEYQSKTNRTIPNGIIYLPASNNSRTITNKDGEYGPIMLTTIYINSVSLFGYGTTIKAPSNIECYFFDTVNSTYYATDKELEYVLNSLVKWHKDSIVQNKKDQQLRKLKEAEKKLQLLKEEIVRQSEYVHELN
jgi:hypothetical protein